MRANEYTNWKLIALIGIALSISACGEGMIDGADDPGASDAVSSELTSSQRRARSILIKQAAQSKGFHNPVLLAGIAMAETHMAHCWSEATWACKGPASSSCGGGAIIAGSGDGPCHIQEGGLGYFQFDAGTYAQTIAKYGQDVLTVKGNTHHAVDYMIDRVMRSRYISNVWTRTQALAWINDVRPNNDKWPIWIKTVTHYYNGCIPGECSVYSQRYNKYDTNTRSIYNEFGHDFWYGDTTTTRPPSPTDAGAMDLPWTCDKTFEVTQGHNSSFSHYGKGAWAWDFGIGVGEPLLAVKDGVVRMVKSSSERHGCDKSYANDANYVVVDFGDGTEALYLHLQAGSVTVKKGDTVKRGQTLGKVGLSGWVCGAHLHFQVQETCDSWWCQSIPASFKTIGDPNYQDEVASDNCGRPIDPATPNGVGKPDGLWPMAKTMGNNQSTQMGWRPVQGAQSYDVLMKYNERGQWKTYYHWKNWQETSMTLHPQFEDRDYTWQVRACNTGGCSQWSDEASLTVGQPADQFASTMTSPAPNSTVSAPGVFMQWQNVHGATGYNVRLDIQNGNTWSHYHTWYSQQTTMTVWPVTRNLNYRVSVQTCMGNQCGAYSATNTFYYAP